VSESSVEQSEVFWVASYPRSGNTLIRIALSRILLPAEAQSDLDKNFPEYVNGREIRLDGVHFPTLNGNVLFLKTHWRQPKDAIRCVGGVYLYRHPVDVFLSALNYMFINSKNVPAFAGYFRDKPQPVEELAGTGALQSYLDQFVHDLGVMPMRDTSGSWIDNLNGWMDRAEQDDILVLSYDSLTSDLGGSMRDILDRAGIEVPAERFEKGLVSARAATKRNGEFFWRASPDTKREFFSFEQIRKAEDALYPQLHYPDRLPRFREVV
jgi:Sulfotransferase domain